MSYLQPPPNMSPVVVVKDFGGYVDQYASITEVYRQTNREVRIHECHSACTMALSLPNVCVYPTSIFKFHQAYDPRNHVTNFAVSDALFRTYPDAVRQRLGALTRSFTILRGQELIDLGVRDCNGPRQPRIMVAAATLKPLPESMTTSSEFSMLTGKLQGLVPGFGAAPVTPAPAQPPAKRAAPTVSDEMLRATIPLPPERPLVETPSPDPAVAPVPDEIDSVPLPPPRPKILVAYTPSLPPIPMMKVIGGSQPILPPRFVPFPKG